MGDDYTELGFECLWILGAKFSPDCTCVSRMAVWAPGGGAVSSLPGCREAKRTGSQETGALALRARGG